MPVRSDLYLAVGAILACLLIAAVTYYATYEPNRRAYPVRGIDVSHHQGWIDWAQVANDDVSFSYMKATEGGDFVDPRFRENWRQSAKHGVLRGAYHFFTFCRPAQIQAMNFISTVPVDSAALPPVMDLEYLGNCTDRPTIKHMENEIRIWLDLVESHYGRQAILYVTKEFYRAYLEPSTISRPLWLRSLARPPRYARHWIIWQYHNRGRVDGIVGPVDLNVARLSDINTAARSNLLNRRANSHQRPIQQWSP